MYTLKLKYHFDSAHRLEFHKGRCFNLHGHRWEVRILIRKHELDKNNLVVDFGYIKDIIDEFDHKTLLKDCKENKPLIDLLIEMTLDVVVLESSPTAENIAKLIKTRIDKKFDINNSEVIVWESPEASIEYYNNEL